MIVGESALAMFAGDWAFASIPSGAFFWGELDGRGSPRMVKELCMVVNVSLSILTFSGTVIVPLLVTRLLKTWD